MSDSEQKNEISDLSSGNPKETTNPGGTQGESGQGGAGKNESAAPSAQGSGEIFGDQIILLCRAVLIAAFMVFICLPVPMFLICGPESVALESEKQIVQPAFSVASYMSGGFQSDFEDWFGQYYPMRSSFVVFYRQLKVNIENISASSPGQNAVETQEVDTLELIDDEGAVDFYFDTENNVYADINLTRLAELPVEPTGFKGSDAVLVGKSGYLYESAYINEMFGYGDPYASVTDEGLKTVVTKLEYIQAQLAKRGITMIYVVSPSKASQYSEYVPDWYKNTQYAADDYVRPYYRMQKFLAESTLNYIDSAELYKQIGLLVTFTKTGIHWNHLASFETARAVISKYEEVTGNTARRMTFDKIVSSESPPGYGNPDQDIYNILYGAIDKTGSIVDKAYYWPDIYVENEDADSIGILVQGGSFCWDFTYLFPHFKVADTYKQFYYNAFQGRKSLDPFGDGGTEAWGKLLEDIDLLIFEQNEQQLRSEQADPNDLAGSSTNYYIGSNAVYESLYQYLKAHET